MQNINNLYKLNIDNVIKSAKIINSVIQTMLFLTVMLIYNIMLYTKNAYNSQCSVK